MHNKGVRVASTLALVISGLPVLFLFQNCGSATESALSDTASYSSEAYDAKIANAPFAFDTNINQITYMSCSLSVWSDAATDGLLDDKAFFSFRVGAYETAGVKISSEMLTYAKDNISHLDGTINDDKAKEAIMKSPANAGAQLQLAIRQRQNFASGVLKLQSTPEAGREYSNIAVPLTNSIVVDQIYGKTQRTNYFSGGSGLENRQIEGSLYFQQQETIAQQVRSFLQNDHLLTMTYMADPELSDQYPFLAREDANNKTMGVGYAITFGQPGYNGMPAQFAGAYSPSVVMKSIGEVKLSTGLRDSSANWTCPSSLQYKIIPRDLADLAANSESYCPAPDDTILNNSGYAAELDILKVHLLPSKWRINPARKCAVPLVGNCYPAPQVIYDGSQACGPDKANDCAHYISVCLRY